MVGRGEMVVWDDDVVVVVGLVVSDERPPILNVLGPRLRMFLRWDSGDLFPD